ncbi:MAG: hypothetical protein ACI9K5_001973 [Gammaproteobacteria bacterium]|jgi:hypothetical protein
MIPRIVGMLGVKTLANIPSPLGSSFAIEEPVEPALCYLIRDVIPLTALDRTGISARVLQAAGDASHGLPEDALELLVHSTAGTPAPE